MVSNRRILIHDFPGHSFPFQLSRALSKRGHTVLHAYSKSFQSPKGNFRKRAEDSKNLSIIPITRDESFPKYSLFKRWVAEKTYSKFLLTIVNNFNPDFIISNNTSIEIQNSLYSYCSKNNIKFINWIQDIYSVGLQQILKVKLPFFGEFFTMYYKALEKRLLTNSHHVVVISEDFLNVIGKWVKNRNITVIENWATIDELRPHPKRNYWSIKNGLSDKFCFLYSGTLGMKHNPGVLLKLAKTYKNQDDTIIVIISEGMNVEWLKTEVTRQGITNVRFFNYLNYELLPVALSSADVLIAILQKDAWTYSVPSKVLSYHCIGKPLLLSVSKKNLSSKIVKNNYSGLVSEPEDDIEFLNSAEQLKKDEKLRIEMGINARKYAEHNFNIDNVCRSFQHLLN